MHVFLKLRIKNTMSIVPSPFRINYNHKCHHHQFCIQVCTNFYIGLSRNVQITYKFLHAWKVVLGSASCQHLYYNCNLLYINKSVTFSVLTYVNKSSLYSCIILMRCFYSTLSLAPSHYCKETHVIASRGAPGEQEETQN